jgi:hypothetical protein
LKTASPYKKFQATTYLEDEEREIPNNHTKQENSIPGKK